MGASLSPDIAGAPAPGRHRWSLLAHLLGLVVVVALVTLGVGGTLTLQGYEDARRRAVGQLRVAVDLAARGISQDLEQAATKAQSIAPSLGGVFAAAAAAGQPLGQVCELTYSPSAVFAQGDQHLLDASGAVACTSRKASLGTDYGGEPWFPEVAAGGPVVASVARDVVSGNSAVVVAAAIPGPAGGPVGTLLSVLAVAPVSAGLADIYGGAAGYDFTIVDGRGRTLSSSTPEAAGQPAPRVAEGNTARDAAGTERIYSSSPVETTDWQVLGGVRSSAALAPAQDELRRRTIITATSLIALLLLAVAIHRRLLQPVRALSGVVTRARSERGVQAAVTGPAELAALAGDLNVMLDARDRAEAELERSGRLLVEAREQERQMLGSRLHDGPIQEMVLTTWVLDDLTGRLPPDALTSVRGRLESAIASSRAIEADLRPPKLIDSGLSEALAELIERRRADSPFGIDVDDGLVGMRFPLHTELLVYRSVQDAIQNLRRNARATQVRITLRTGAGFLTAVVADDDPAGGPQGLESVRDTVTLAGGRFRADSRPEGGLELQVDVPVVTEGPD